MNSILQIHGQFAWHRLQCSSLAFRTRSAAEIPFFSPINIVSLSRFSLFPFASALIFVAALSRRLGFYLCAAKKRRIVGFRHCWINNSFHFSMSFVQSFNAFRSSVRPSVRSLLYYYRFALEVKWRVIEFQWMSIRTPRPVLVLRNGATGEQVKHPRHERQQQPFAESAK